MRVGVSLRSSYAPPDARTGARWMVEQAAVAWDAGVDSLFVGDHHVTGGAYYQNTPILGRLLAEWGDRPAGALFLLPLWNPVLVAEQVGTLAALAAGPFILQAALGAGSEQFAGMGASLRGRAALFERNLDVVRRLLAGEPVGGEGVGEGVGEGEGVGVGDGVGVGVGPLPSEPVDVWIGGTAERAIDRAARLGDAWLAGPELVPWQAASLIEVYRDRCATHGRVPSAVAIRRDVHVGADENDAWRVAGPILDRGYRGFDRSAVIVGSPQSVAEQFRALENLGYTDVIVRPLADDQAETLACLRRLPRP